MITLVVMMSQIMQSSSVVVVLHLQLSESVKLP